MVSISDKFGKASIDSDHAIATTVKTIRSSGGSVLEAYDVSKFPTDTPAYFVTYKKTTAPVTGVVSVTNLVSWKALVNTGANTLTNLTVAPGYVDAGNAVGDFIELVPTSYWENSMVDGIRTHSNPDGTLKADTVTTLAIADASVTGAKIATYRVARQNDTTNVTENTAKILTGWGWVAVGGLGTGIEIVTFSSAFTTLPIVTLTYGGDHASSTTYGAGTLSLKQGFGGAIGITTTGFSAYVRSADGSNWPAGANAFYQWTAIGN